MTSRSKPVATPSPFSCSQRNTIEQEQPHLSAGAYIRSFIVKQLSSRAQHTMSSSSMSQDQEPQQGHDEQAPVVKKPQMKKQTRRRVHASRPYQERLLNMAEARREIVTALRIHRASMRQQSKYQHEQRQQPRLQQQPVHQMMFQEQSQAFGGVPSVAMSYASSSNNHLCSSPLANLIASAPAGGYSSSMLCYDFTPLEEETAAAAIGGPEQLACSLPVQPLGLNLSFQDFGSSLDNIKNSDDDPFGIPLIQSSSCPAPAASSYSAYPSSPVTAMAGHGEYSSADAPAALSQRVLDGDGEMLSSIGGGGWGCERQAMKLSETAANVAAASAWWTKILESMESAGAPPQTTTGAEAGMADDDMVAAAGWPEWQWLCDGGVGVGVEQEVTAAGPKPDVLEMRVDDGDCYEGDRKDNGRDIALPCVDDIEGWDDGEWFS